MENYPGRTFCRKVFGGNFLSKTSRRNDVLGKDFHEDGLQGDFLKKDETILKSF